MLFYIKRKRIIGTYGLQNLKYKQKKAF